MLNSKLNLVVKILDQNISESKLNDGMTVITKYFENGTSLYKLIQNNLDMNKKFDKK